MQAAVPRERAATAPSTLVSPRLLLLVTAILALLGGLYLAVRRPVLPIDDPSLYVTTAQALAQGEGYRVVAYVDAPLNTFTPPVYTLLLAALFKLQPDFPANLTLLELTSLVTFYALLALGAVVLRRCYGASGAEIGLALLLVASTPLASSLSTAVMTDTLFGAFALASVMLVRAGWRRPGAAGLLLLLAGALLASLAYYTRLVGVALVAALALDALRRARPAGWSRVAVLLLPAALMLPWLVWVSLNGGSGYARHLLSAGPNTTEPFGVGASILAVVVDATGILWAVAPALADLWPLGTALLVYVLWQSWRGWQRDREVVHLYVLLYLLLVLPTAIPVRGRYVWPIAPLVAWYLVAGLRHGGAYVSARLGRPLWRADWLVLGTLLLVNAIGVAGITAKWLTSGWTVDEPYRHQLATMQQIGAHLRTLDPPEAPLGTNHWSATPWQYLYTGRRGVDAVARTDGAEPFWVRQSVQGDPEAITYFVYHRDNGRPFDDTDDLPTVQAALRARGASAEPLYCTEDQFACIFDWRRRTPSP